MNNFGERYQERIRIEETKECKNDKPEREKLIDASIN